MAAKKPRSKRKPAAMNCRVYVINLKRTVRSSKRFLAANPDYRDGKPCVYVGSTSRTYEERLAQHRSGKRASWCVKRFGKSLRRSACLPGPFTREGAESAERRLAQALRGRGWGVWSN